MIPKALAIDRLD